MQNHQNIQIRKERHRKHQKIKYNQLIIIIIIEK
jgi:hypothetical protein